MISSEDWKAPLLGRYISPGGRPGFLLTISQCATCIEPCRTITLFSTSRFLTCCWRRTQLFGICRECHHCFVLCHRDCCARSSKVAANSSSCSTMRFVLCRMETMSISLSVLYIYLRHMFRHLHIPSIFTKFSESRSASNKAQLPAQSSWRLHTTHFHLHTLSQYQPQSKSTQKATLF